MPPVCAVAARVGSQLPSNGVGWTWNFDPGPMAFGAPRAARAGMQNPGWNALPGNTMGGGCQANKTDVVYAQAVPPSRNGGGRAGSVVEQRAYFSAWRMVFDVPSVMKAMPFFPCGSVLYGVALRSLIAFTMALAA